MKNKNTICTKCLKNLDPANLTLEVLSYKDLKLASLGGALFMAHQVSKELMATMESLKNLSSIAKADR
ncbi:hypothetical protein [Moorena sp. SIO3H5]|uniref:hypothetical protein n=1 Tax=Moorena sp. SIO3H5 TaxID=2607834 RepID=UPI0013B8E46D|nr:hypothetical protein [Moorena sp. SIO3H5]NEO70271.1 hypothetical protein [Moorena sp. SIO3H5]